MIYDKISKCMICGNEQLDPILDLGEQSLTGIFPKSINEDIPKAPLELVKCRESEDGDTCGLLQLKHYCDSSILYGESYGYRSGLNQSMVRHLKNKVKKIENLINLQDKDLVIDIGSNDGTLLQFYRNKNLLLVGIDPTGMKFKSFYPEYITLIPDFFSSDLIQNNYSDKKAKVVTSIAMFYDLKNPMEFMKQVYDILDDNGIWLFEQSYMPIMLEKTSYDTICHEHLEYYGLRQIKWMTDRVGFKIIDIELNDVNGGSFSLVVSKTNSRFSEDTKTVNYYIECEKSAGLDTLAPYLKFRSKIYEHRNHLLDFISKAKKEGQTIFGCGASTKGNVILQFCNLTPDDIPYISEVNEDKFGSFTPGTKIPIISEKEARKLNPDYFMVLPWHFKESIIQREKVFLNSGGKLVFPLPTIEIVSNLSET